MSNYIKVQAKAFRVSAAPAIRGQKARARSQLPRRSDHLDAIKWRITRNDRPTQAKTLLLSNVSLAKNPEFDPSLIVTLGKRSCHCQCSAVPSLGVTPSGNVDIRTC